MEEESGGGKNSQTDVTVLPLRRLGHVNTGLSCDCYCGVIVIKCNRFACTFRWPGCVILHGGTKSERESVCFSSFL